MASNCPRFFMLSHSAIRIAISLPAGVEVSMPSSTLTKAQPIEMGSRFRWGVRGHTPCARVLTGSGAERNARDGVSSRGGGSMDSPFEVRRAEIQKRSQWGLMVALQGRAAMALRIGSLRPVSAGLRSARVDGSSHHLQAVTSSWT